VTLLDELDAALRGGRKLLVPYLMGGAPDRDSFAAALEAVAHHADAVEVGLPYSDPLMDGPLIAAAGERVLRMGIGPLAALELAGGVSVRPPKVVMTYYNPIHRIGEDEFCGRAKARGYEGLIVPDLPLEESTTLRGRVAHHGLAWVPLVAPTSSPERTKEIADSATGFVYAVSTLGVTGVRERLSELAATVVSACRAVTDLPVLVGIGISSPELARVAAEQADGVVIGSAVVRRIVDEGPTAARSFLGEVRTALDAG
jgi:tryptophan synthase alpha chain